eukprot:9066555-Pyramimonas_sp.AAC.1
MVPKGRSAGKQTDERERKGGRPEQEEEEEEKDEEEEEEEEEERDDDNHPSWHRIRSCMLDAHMRGRIQTLRRVWVTAESVRRERDLAHTD